MMKNAQKRLWGTVILLLCLTTPLAAQESDLLFAEEASLPAIPQEIRVTQGNVTIDGADIRYRAETGLLPIYDSMGGQNAWIFSISYLTDPVPSAPIRPVTFFYNGGPGSSSLYVHAAAFGPRVLPVSEPGTQLALPPYRLTENGDCLLDLTDMVFVDPVGTGYSRPAAPEGGHEFWGVDEDVKSLAEFIRVWLIRHKRWGDPIYLAGESYGGMRTARLADYLERIGIMPSGLIMLSPVLSYQELYKAQSNYRPYVHSLPTMTAIAQYHGRLQTELQQMPQAALRDQVRQWAEKVYQPALWKGTGLSPQEYDEVARGLARYTGLSRTDVEAGNLRISNRQFLSSLLKDRRLCASAYDGRITASGAWHSYDDEPSSAVRGAPYHSAFMRYLIDVLDFQTDQPYVVLSQEAFDRWDFSSAVAAPGSYPETTDSLAHLMLKIPFVKVFLGCGRYDLVTPIESAMFSLGRMDLPLNRRNRIEIHDYEGGHMMYLNPAARAQLKSDLKAFYGK